MFVLFWINYIFFKFYYLFYIWIIFWIIFGFCYKFFVLFKGLGWGLGKLRFGLSEEILEVSIVYGIRDGEVRYVILFLCEIVKWCYLVWCI